MKVHIADFVTSSVRIGQCPKPILPEYAFIGRSNVGKSSIINMLVGRKNLAKTSSRPGKTQLINHFIINEQWYLVDLPGLGYAKVSKYQRAKWQKMINNYLLKRENLLNIFVLIDSRIEPQRIDVDFINWLGLSQLPFIILFTKTDKLSPARLKTYLERYYKELRNTWDELPQIIVTSANTKRGKEEILDFIEETNMIFK